MNKIRKFELEITSICNAECHVCHRTKNPNNFELTSLTLEDIKSMFPSGPDLEGMQFLLCGSIGDPVANKECYEITEYLVSNNAFCELNSNTSLQTTEWWAKLGKLSADTKKVNVWFCVDGHRETNHIYRKNTNFDVIERNMQAYSDAGGQGVWMYVLFDHNEHEIEIAKEHAKKLNFSFSTRRGPANDMPKLVQIKTKDKETKEVKVETKLIRATGNNVHSRKEELEVLKQFIKDN